MAYIVSDGIYCIRWHIFSYFELQLHVCRKSLQIQILRTPSSIVWGNSFVLFLLYWPKIGNFEPNTAPHRHIHSDLDHDDWSDQNDDDWSDQNHDDRHQRLFHPWLPPLGRVHHGVGRLWPEWNVSIFTTLPSSLSSPILPILMMCQEHNSLHGGDGAVEEHRPSSWLWQEVPRQDGLQKADQVEKPVLIKNVRRISNFDLGCGAGWTCR